MVFVFVFFFFWVNTKLSITDWRGPEPHAPEDGHPPGQRKEANKLK